ncbi:hypothetical protein P171DRAFT_36231 [Karstenula rhodostoma CBS 690.94]|uniref:Uncharacterized protein n=1 Tax=Karstenula rhodostoma CBS 690.94 TaxID=1392251 RepID=A0A9P4PG19_9PLEO|nr:hypothetical protein P171DRAFT_36231 [Karstenula rhodostoma CBS 690.94]
MPRYLNSSHHLLHRTRTSRGESIRLAGLLNLEPLPRARGRIVGIFLIVMMPIPGLGLRIVTLRWSNTNRSEVSCAACLAFLGWRLWKAFISKNQACHDYHNTETTWPRRDVTSPY